MEFNLALKEREADFLLDYLNNGFVSDLKKHTEQDHFLYRPDLAYRLQDSIDQEKESAKNTEAAQWVEFS